MDNANQNTPKEENPMDNKSQSKQPSKPFSTKMTEEEFDSFRDHFLQAGYLPNANALDFLKEPLMAGLTSFSTRLDDNKLLVKQLVRHMIASLTELGLPDTTQCGLGVTFWRDDIRDLLDYLTTGVNTTKDGDRSVLRPPACLFRKLAWLSMQRWKEEGSCTAKGDTPTHQEGSFLGMTAGKPLVPTTEKGATNSDNPFAWLDQLSLPRPDYEKDKKICDLFVEHLKKRLGK
ncbi:MAG: hypothetical protein ACI4QD_07020 [Kiritimatiellia bacterium]